MRITTKDYEVVGYIPEICRSCDPDIPFKVAIHVFRNKEVRRYHKSGNIERVCLVCEFKTKLDRETEQQKSAPLPEKVVEPEIMMA